MAIEIYPTYLRALNKLAWLLSTCEEHKYRNGKMAVRIALRAVEIEKNYLCLDTLSAAYAQSGDLEKAIAISENLIKKADSYSIKPEHLGKIRENHKRYLAKQEKIY